MVVMLPKDCAECGKPLREVYAAAGEKGEVRCSCGHLIRAAANISTIADRIAELHQTMDRLEETLASIVEISGGDPFGNCETCNVAQIMGEITPEERALLCEGCELADA